MEKEAGILNNLNKRILLINVPSRRGRGGKTLPLGLLYAGSIIERCGHIAKIYDPYLNDENLTKLDSGDYTELGGILEEFHPDIVGFGGIASSFGRTKKISDDANRDSQVDKSLQRGQARIGGRPQIVSR